MSLKIEEFKDTALGKAWRTTYQSLVTIAPFMLALLNVPEVKTAIENPATWSLATWPVLVFLFTYIQNKANK